MNRKKIEETSKWTPIIALVLLVIVSIIVIRVGMSSIEAGLIAKVNRKKVYLNKTRGEELDRAIEELSAYYLNNPNEKISEKVIRDFLVEELKPVYTEVARKSIGDLLAIDDLTEKGYLDSEKNGPITYDHVEEAMDKYIRDNNDFSLENLKKVQGEDILDTNKYQYQFLAFTEKEEAEDYIDIIRKNDISGLGDETTYLDVFNNDRHYEERCKMINSIDIQPILTHGGSKFGVDDEDENQLVDLDILKGLEVGGYSELLEVGMEDTPAYGFYFLEDKVDRVYRKGEIDFDELGYLYKIFLKDEYIDGLIEDSNYTIYDKTKNISQFIPQYESEEIGKVDGESVYTTYYQYIYGDTPKKEDIKDEDYEEYLDFFINAKVQELYKEEIDTILESEISDEEIRTYIDEKDMDLRDYGIIEYIGEDSDKTYRELSSDDNIIRFIEIYSKNKDLDYELDDEEKSILDSYRVADLAYNLKIEDNLNRFYDELPGDIKDTIKSLSDRELSKPMDIEGKPISIIKLPIRVEDVRSRMGEIIKLERKNKLVEELEEESDIERYNIIEEK